MIKQIEIFFVYVKNTQSLHILAQAALSSVMLCSGILNLSSKFTQIAYALDLKKFLKKSSFIVCLMFCLPLGFASMATNASAAATEWGNTTTGTGTLKLDEDITGNIKNITLGGAKLVNDEDLIVFDSELIINDKTVKSVQIYGKIELYGGYANGLGNHIVTDNSVYISNSMISTDNENSSINIYGGKASGLTPTGHNASNNTVKLDGTVDILTEKLNSSINIVGGHASNHVTDGGNKANDNTVTIDGIVDISTIGKNSTINIIGGNATGDVLNTGGHEANDNTVTLEGTIDISTKGETSHININGGYAKNNATTGHEANDNTVTLDGTINISAEGASSNINIYGGNTSSNLGPTGHEAINNTVRLGGTVNISATGTITIAGGIPGGAKHDVRTGNTLILDEATVDLTQGSGTSTVKNFENYEFMPSYEQIVGDTPMLKADIIDLGMNAANVGAMLTISGNIDINSTEFLSKAEMLDVGTDFILLQADTKFTGEFENIGDIHTLEHGRYLSYGVTTEQTGNGTNAGTLTATIQSLTLAGAGVGYDILTLNSPLDLGTNSTVKDFNTYIFAPSYDHIINNPDIPLLEAINIELGASNNAILDISISPLPKNAPVIANGTEFTLMQAINISGEFANINDIHTLQQGSFLGYDISTTQNDTTLTATINSKLKAVDQAAIPARAKIGSSAMLSQGANHVSGAGMSSAAAAAGNIGYVSASSYGQNSGEQNVSGFGSEDIDMGNLATKNSNFPWASFAAISYGNSRYGGDSYTNVSGFSFMGGISRRFAISQGNLLFGTFFEYGKATLDTHGSFDTQDNINGTGDSSYIGYGILGRIDYNSGIYVDTSLRIGSATTEHSSTEYTALLGQNVSYKTTSTYFSTHLALGYNWKLADFGNLDVNGKYFWTHISGNKAVIANDKFTFKPINSNRLRLGARYSLTTHEYLSPYLGAAYEYEFDSYAHSSVDGFEIDDTPNLRGSTGIFEAGLRLMPIDGLPVTIDFGVEAYTGMRQGYNLSLQLVFEF